MKILTGVSAVLSAAHRDRDGNLHGHTWQVTAWWDDEPDAVQKQKDLKEYLTIFDHHILADNVAWGEYLGKTILIGMDCVRVDVSRPLEGIYALVERAA
jgi:6-pyruvoyl-tetrahydropterin synthase